MNESTDPPSLRVVARLVVEEDGRFFTTQHHAGRYVIIAGVGPSEALGEFGTGWGCHPVVVDTRKGPVKDLEVSLKREVEVVLRPSPGNPQGAYVRITTADGFLCWHRHFDGDAPCSLALIPGVYNLRLTKGHEVVRDIPFTVGTSPVTIDVAP